MRRRPVPHVPSALPLTLSWIIVPALIVIRRWQAEHPFTRAVSAASEEDASA